MIKVTYDNFDEYAGEYVYIPELNTYGELARAYTNGFFTSAGFMKDLYVTEDVPQDLVVVSHAVDLLPIEWHFLECDFLDEYLRPVKHGRIKTVRFDVLKEIVQQDIPHTDLPCFIDEDNVPHYAVKLFLYKRVI